MFTYKQFRISYISLATLGIVFLFFILFVTQLSCGDGNSKKTGPVTEAETDVSGGVVLSGIVPSEVSLPNPDTLSPENNRPFFDDFSWKSFIALCWPVQDDQRGVPLNPNDPGTFLSMTNTTPVVWTSYKNQWDLFGQKNKTPSNWNSWDNPVNLCSENLKHIFFGSVNGQIAADANESFSVPLIDQNKNYSLFEIRYNEPQYNFILNNGLYLSSNLYKYQKAHGDTVAMPASTASSQGSILVKAAWRKLTANDSVNRYYTINETVYDPVTKKCSKQLMGLVGLHIAQKVDSFPQWVWSSFEQVDNVPGAANAKLPYSFNNGKDTPNTSRHGFANKPVSTSLNPDPATRMPVQVTRLNEIPVTPKGNSTVDINKKYQAAVGNTWMKYYQLVITQWPTNPQQFKQNARNGIYPQDCGVPFPVYNCVNTTMETYFQSGPDAAAVGGNSCMSCHYTAPNTDFSWSLLLRSH